MKYADRVDELKASDVREILKIAGRPEVISFAGGLPAPELFPVEKIREATNLVLDESAGTALQYCASAGPAKLREQISARMAKKVGAKIDPNFILPTCGSQQGLDFCARLFLNPGDVVLMESPSYLGAINAFQICQPKFVTIPTDNDGMIMEELEKVLETTENVKMIYVIPDFQNPSGRTWTMERRKKFIEIINKYELPVVEDNPYGELRYKGEFLPCLKSMDTKGLVIYMGTFSKILAPGYRIGWMCADAEVFEKLELLMSAAALQASTTSMAVIAKFLEIADLDEHVDKIRRCYEHRCGVMMKAMEEYFPPEAKFTYPEGGLFTWVELPEYIDTKVMAEEALEQHVAYVPGIGFYPNGEKKNCMRLNYSNMPDERIVEGIKRLAQVIRNNLR